MPESLKQPWQSEIAKCLEGMEKTPENASCRQTLKMALTVLNAQMDTLFWDIWVKKLFTLAYTIMLLLLLAGLYSVGSCTGQDDLCLGLVFTLGAIGGVASGIMTGEPLYISKGHFWVSCSYYILSRPVQGALAALIMFWMIQSQYLISTGGRIGGNTNHRASRFTRNGSRDSTCAERRGPACCPPKGYIHST
jgi:hypothetical protein